ncbi:MAG: GGDEF domain-containing protein [Acholeplasmataceae bacterium]|nr:GGDEF domain-containing protein [Acholeplasmataceae bacterium]
MRILGLNDAQSIMFSDLINSVDLSNKYAEIAGKERYMDYVYGEVFNFTEEVDITFPILANGIRKWLRFNIFPVEKNKDISVFFISDVSDLLIKEELIYEKTHKDTLTNLLNKYSLDFHYGLRYLLPNFHVLYLNLDNFKIMNDTYGHATGNEFLRKFADILRLYESEVNRFYRIGGDEFVGLIFDDAEKIKKIANDIVQKTKQIRIPHCDKVVTVSIGVVKAIQRDDVIRKADDVLYQVKSSGKDKYHYQEEKQ